MNCLYAGMTNRAPLVCVAASPKFLGRWLNIYYARPAPAV